MSNMQQAHNNNNVIKLANLAVSCSRCALHGICEPPGLHHQHQARLDAVIRKRRPLARGEYLFRSGDPFVSMFCVRSGSIKTYTTNDDGDTQVTGFHLPGELIGLSAISAAVHTTSALVLETSSVCEIPYDRLQGLAQGIPELQGQLTALMSSEILHYQTLMLLIGRKSAEERLAAFLLSLSQRFQRRGLSPNEYYLSMSRIDIGNYLGMAVETVSRVFTRFHDENLLTVRRKHIQLHDIDRLAQLAGTPRVAPQVLARS